MMQFAVAEGLVWRAVEMVQRLDLNALSDASGKKHVAAATDTSVQIALVSFADLAAAVRSAYMPLSRAPLGNVLVTLGVRDEGEKYSDMGCSPSLQTMSHYQDAEQLESCRFFASSSCSVCSMVHVLMWSCARGLNAICISAASEATLLHVRAGLHEWERCHGALTWPTLRAFLCGCMALRWRTSPCCGQHS